MTIAVSLLSLSIVVTLFFCGQSDAGNAITSGTGLFTLGSCKKPFLKKDFDLSKYAGLWYEHQRFPNNFEEGLVCIQAYYAGLSETFLTRPQISVRNAGRKGSVTSTEKEVIDGTAFLSWVPGALKVKFSGAAPFYAPYKVIDTDYQTYAAVYSCTNFVFFKIEFAWILSKETTISDSTLTLAKEKFSSNGIDVSKFLSITQEPECRGRYVLNADGSINA